MGTPLPFPKRRPHQFLAHVYCGKTAGCMKLVLGMVVGLSPGDFVFDGDIPLPQKGAEPPPQFSAHFYCGQMAGCIKMPLGTDVGLSPGDFVLDGEQGAESPKTFSAHVYCGQTAGWIKMPLGTKVGLSPDDSVLDEDPNPLPKGKRRPGDQDGSWHGGRPWSSPHCVR